jgi:CRISPR-associated protein Csm5
MVWAYGLGWIMSNRIDHAQLSLTIVSPTNIGGPETLTTKDYMYNYHTGEVYLLNNYEWFCFLERHNKLAEFEVYMQNEMVRSNGRTMYDWAKQALGTAQLTREVLGPAVHSVMKATAYNQGLKNSLNDIIPQIRGVDGRVYIPGSSIKGVIDSAIISHMLRTNSKFRSSVQQQLEDLLYKYSVNKNDKRRAKREISSILRKVNDLITNQISVLVDKNGRQFKGILASAFRGISVSDAMSNHIIQTEVLKKEDAGVDEDGTHSISVNRECILPNQTLSFTLTLDTAITKEIGITNIDQVLEILQQDFDATHELLISKFTKVNPSVFKALEPANAFIGGNTGFIQKTVIMAAFTDDINKGVEVIRALLDVNFQKAGHDRKDKFMAPRAIKLVKWNGHYYEMGGIRIGR